jgi:hypothetical protein
MNYFLNMCAPNFFFNVTREQQVEGIYWMKLVLLCYRLFWLQPPPPTPIHFEPFNPLSWSFFSLDSERGGGGGAANKDESKIA